VTKLEWKKTRKRLEVRENGRPIAWVTREGGVYVWWAWNIRQRTGHDGWSTSQKDAKEAAETAVARGRSVLTVVLTLRSDYDEVPDVQSLIDDLVEDGELQTFITDRAKDQGVKLEIMNAVVENPDDEDE
jgi:hypothetical protein